MIWRPDYTANGWYPKLSWPWLAHGFGECWLVNLETNEHRRIVPQTRCQPAGWLGPEKLCYYVGELPAVVWAEDVQTGDTRHLGSGNVNRVCARNGSWATGLAAGGIVTLNGQEIACNVGWRVDVDGPVLACTANDGLHVWESGHPYAIHPPQTALVDPRVSGGWVGYGYNGPARAYNVHSGADLDVTVTPWRKEHAPVVVDGWIWTTTERPDGTSAAIGRPIGDDTCLVLECASAVALDVQRVGDDWVVATSGTRGELLVQTVRVDAPRVTIAPMDPPAEVQPIAPFASHFYAACYKDPSLKAPANVIFAPEPLMAPITGPAIVGPFRKTLDCAVGWTLAIEDVEAARTTALACKAVKDLPVYAYLGGYVPEARIDGIDYPLLQAYRLPGRETAAAILAQLRADLTRCAYARVGLAVDLTDRTLPGVGGWPEADRLVFLVGLADLCREIQPAAVMAWAWDRKAPQAGLSSSALVTEQWRRFVEAIPAPVDPPPVDPDPPVIPEVPMQPYDESLVYATNEKVRGLYAAALHPPDDQYPIWSARTVYDYCAGMSWAASEAKHLAELRRELGLLPPTPPVGPVTDTWPRRGLSYYTSATDPRLDIHGFAARLRDAGATFTRVWLLDAWAIGASAGTGCYDGFVPWMRQGDGRYDLWQVNSAYLDRLRAYVEAMNAAGVLPQVSGLELYTWSDRKQGMLWVPDANLGPFRRNRQGVYYGDDSAFQRIGQPSGEDAFLGHFYGRVVETLTGTAWCVELGNEMPEKELHARLRQAWRAAGYRGSLSVNRQDDTPGQYANMKIGQPDGYNRIAFHGKREIGYLDEAYPDEPVHKTFRAFYGSGPDASRIILSSDGCRKSTNPDDAYAYPALAEVFTDALARGCSAEHQSALKLRGFVEGRIDLNDVEVDWFRSL